MQFGAMATRSRHYCIEIAAQMALNKAPDCRLWHTILALALWKFSSVARVLLVVIAIPISAIAESGQTISSRDIDRIVNELDMPPPFENMYYILLQPSSYSHAQNSCSKYWGITYDFKCEMGSGQRKGVMYLDYDSQRISSAKLEADFSPMLDTLYQQIRYQVDSNNTEQFMKALNEGMERWMKKISSTRSTYVLDDGFLEVYFEYD